MSFKEEDDRVVLCDRAETTANVGYSRPLQEGGDSVVLLVANCG